MLLIIVLLSVRTRIGWKRAARVAWEVYVGEYLRRAGDAASLIERDERSAEKARELQALYDTLVQAELRREAHYFV